MPAPTLEEIRNGILAWGLQNGIVADTVSRPQTSVRVDPTIVPFNDEHAEFFRTRKIVRVTVQSDRKKVVTIFSRLPIAERKKSELIDAFDHAFKDQRFILKIDVSKPFKVDNTLQAYGKFEPIHKRRKRIACGSSVGLGNQRNAGTLSALAMSTDKNDKHIYGLSCNHVVGGCSTARPGTPIVVPGIQDVSTEHNEIVVIGKHVTAASMSQGLPDVTNISRNRDLAYFRLHEPDLLTSMQGSGSDAYDTPSQFAAPKVGMTVKKWGRSTRMTQGRISNIIKGGEPLPYDITSYYGPMNSQRFKGTIYFDEVYEVDPAGKPFSLGGDSGALVVTSDAKTPRVVGIVIAGEKTKSLVLPLEPALRELKLKLLSGHHV